MEDYEQIRLDVEDETKQNKKWYVLYTKPRHEIKALERFLKIAPDWLLPEGIISIISFHSLEDRLVKTSFKNDQRLRNLTKKPITPNEKEIEKNKRSRSAKLRIAQLRS